MSADAKAPLRLVSFNMQNRLGEPTHTREERLGRIASLLTSLEPDVVCLQEALITDKALLEQRLSARATAYKPRDDGERVGEGTPIFILSEDFEMRTEEHYWLSETPDSPSRSWGAKHNRVVTVLKLETTRGLPPLWLCNLHLDHGSRLVREHGLALAHERLGHWVQPGEEALLCGDFNMRPPALAKAGLLEARTDAPGLHFQDAAMVDEVLAIHPTYPGWSPLRLFAGRIDYCLHTPGLHCVRYAVHEPVAVKARLSDHRIIVFDFVPGGER